MSARSRRGWVASVVFGVTAVALLALSVTPVPEQPVFAQTAAPPVPRATPVPLVPLTEPGGNVVPGTEITPTDDGFVAYIPTSDGLVSLVSPSGETIRLALENVVGPVTVQVHEASGTLLAFDAQGAPLVVTLLASGVYQLNQPS